jgi:outer membrane protein OmpA-like peptidoglycan-associated protein
MAKCKTCDPHDICEECPEWIFTLADLIMCMMGLFVILWVLKPEGQAPPEVAQAKQEQLIETIAAIREALGYKPDFSASDRLDPVDLHILMKQLERIKTNGPGEKGRTMRHAQGIDGTDPEVTNIRPGPHTVVGAPIAFGAGQASLDDAMRQLLDQVASQISGHRNIVIVKGHTSMDDLPDADEQARLELSLRRAGLVADYLIERGVRSDTLRVQGCSTHEPVVQRVYTPDSQRLNRRVEVIATSTLVSEFQDPHRSPTTLTTPSSP